MPPIISFRQRRKKWQTMCCGSNEEPYQFGSVPAKIAQLVIVDILFQEYFHRNQESCEKNRLQIGAALAEMHF